MSRRLRQAVYSSLPLRPLQAEPFSAALIPKIDPEIKNRCTQKDVSGVNLASIRKSGLEIKNRCTKEGVNREKLASIRKSGLEIKNRCTQKGTNREKHASIRKFGPEIKNRCTKEGVNGHNLAAIPKFTPSNQESLHARGPILGITLQRFPISAPELAITAAPDPFPWISLQTNGVRHGAAAEECRMGRDFGRRTRPWLREEGPAAQRWEGKHRRCAPVRSPCPQADSAAETAQTPQADSAAGTRPSPRRVRKSYWTD